MITIKERQFAIRPASTMENFQTLELLRKGLSTSWTKQPFMALSPTDLLLLLPSPLLEIIRQRLFAQVDCTIPGQRPQPLLHAEDACFNGLRPSAVYDVMMAVWEQNFANLNDDLNELAKLMKEDGMAKAAAEPQFSIGDVTFSVLEFKGFAGWQTLEIIRAALGDAKEEWGKETPNLARRISLPETLLHIPAAALAGVRSKLFEMVQYERDDGEAGRLAGEEDTAFANLGAGAVYRVMANAAAVNFSDCYPETLRIMTSAERATTPLLQAMFTHSLASLLTPDTPPTLTAEITSL